MTGPNESLEQRLRALRQEPPDEHGFSMELHRRLVASGPPQPVGLRYRLSQWLSLRPMALGSFVGALAGVAAFGLLYGLTSGMPNAHEPVRVATGSQVHVVPAQKVALIRFQFATDVAVRDVDMRIALPKGLVFWSEGEALAERQFSWVADLESGTNEIPIAVRGESPGRYTVVASAVIDGRWIDHEVVLNVTEGA